MLELCTLASGSSGNSLLVTDGRTHVLVDAGISCRRICTGLKELGVEPTELAGVLITHEHSDHISGLTTLTKQLRLPVYASPGTGRQLCYRIAFLEELLRPVAPGEGFSIGGLAIESFPTSHDAAESVGYALSAGGRKAAVVTDLGYVTGAVLRGIRGRISWWPRPTTTWSGCSPAPTLTTSRPAFWATGATCPTRRGPSWPGRRWRGRPHGGAGPPVP